MLASLIIVSVSACILAVIAIRTACELGVVKADRDHWRKSANGWESHFNFVSVDQKDTQLKLRKQIAELKTEKDDCGNHIVELEGEIESLSRKLSGSERECGWWRSRFEVCMNFASTTIFEYHKLQEELSKLGKFEEASE
ncbi:hypothetical protein KOR42_05890 [Thalassoglobus neptunius]|uniref:Uncharacterized protein n=1 Tax=Thalassoglobus neptunius TaxID=1938619 RepID=A0A5C5X4I0_9PLAN|nr:hypothetical protein KOR42_05890 [Thalassoglobus neptunius]